jgi:hypothetical protein
LLLSSSLFSNPREFASTPPPPPPLLPPFYASQLMQYPYAKEPQQQQHFLKHSGQQSELDREEGQGHREEPEDTKLLSPWFPSVPASDCQGTFEFTIEGIVDVEGKKLKTGSHKIILKLDAAGPDINGKLWIDKKKENDKGYNFDVEKTFNNCRVVTASSPPPSSLSQSSMPQNVPSASSSTLLGNSPAVDHTSSRDSILSLEELKDAPKRNNITLDENSPNEEEKEKIGNEKKAENNIATLN